MKAAGVVMYQTDDSNAGSFSLTDFVSQEGFTKPDLYGSDGTSISSNNAIIATTLKVNLLCP